MSLPARTLPDRPGAGVALAPMGEVLLLLLLLALLLPAIARQLLPAGGPVAAPVAAPVARDIQLILDASPDGLRLNGQPVPDAELEPTLRAIFAPRRVRLLFLRIDGTPGPVAPLVARLHRAGIATVALLPAAP